MSFKDIQLSKDLLKVLLAILPSNIKDNDIIRDSLEVFVQILEEESPASINIRKILEDKDFQEEIVKTYNAVLINALNDLKSNPQFYQANEKHKQITGNNLLDKDFLDSPASFFGKEQMNVMRSFYEKKGTVHSIRFIHEWVRNFYDSSESLYPISIEEYGPFSIGINNNMDPAVYHNIVRKLAHPLGFVYAYYILMRIFIKNDYYFNISASYVPSILNVTYRDKDDIIVTVNFLKELEIINGELIESQTNAEIIQVNEFKDLETKTTEIVFSNNSTLRLTEYFGYPLKSFEYTINGDIFKIDSGNAFVEWEFEYTIDIAETSVIDQLSIGEMISINEESGDDLLLFEFHHEPVSPQTPFKNEISSYDALLRNNEGPESVWNTYNYDYLGRKKEDSTQAFQSNDYNVETLNHSTLTFEESSKNLGWFSPPSYSDWHYNKFESQNTWLKTKIKFVGELKNGSLIKINTLQGVEIGDSGLTKFSDIDGFTKGIVQDTSNTHINPNAEVWQGNNAAWDALKNNQYADKDDNGDIYDFEFPKKRVNPDDSGTEWTFYRALSPRQQLWNTMHFKHTATNIDPVNMQYYCVESFEISTV